MASEARLGFDGGAAAVGLALILCVGIVRADTAGPPASRSQGRDLSASSEATRRFEREVQLAETAQGRDAKIERFRNALKQRPGHPDNLAAEFRIAVLLSQYYDPKNPQPVRRKDSVAVYQHILQTYEHMDYYGKDPVNSSSDLQFMIPEAAIHLACLHRGLDGDNTKGRTLRWSAWPRPTRAALKTGPTNRLRPRSGKMIPSEVR